MTKSRNILKPRKHWTEAEDALLRACYPYSTANALAKALKVEIQTIYARANKLSIGKSPWFKTSSLSGVLKPGTTIGAEHRFSKGLAPYNKGMRGVVYAGSVATQFKPGQLSGRAAEQVKPIGAERISKDGYLERKVNNDLPFQKRWRAVHIIVWELSQGRSLPLGHVVIFRNGDKRDIRFDNLELVTRAELMRRNTVHNLPKELAKAIQLRGALNRRINHARKH